MSSATRQGALNPPAAPKDNNWKRELKMSAKIQLSDHFTYRKLFRFTLPSIVMMVFTSIYGVVDGYFISNYAGKTAFASVNLVMPFIMILGGMGFMIGTGGTALVSVVLGQKDHERANRYFSMMIYLTVIMGVILSVLGFTFMKSIAVLLGATEEMLAGFNIYCSSFFTALNNGAISAAVSFLRTLVFQTSAVLILPLILNVDGIWLSNAFAEVFAFAISAIFLIAKRKKYHYMQPT